MLDALPISKPQPVTLYPPSYRIETSISGHGRELTDNLCSQIPYFSAAIET